MTDIIKLPAIPTREQYCDTTQFYAALSAWQTVCHSVAQRSPNVQPAEMPRREQYLNTEQFYAALVAWEAVFTD